MKLPRGAPIAGSVQFALVLLLLLNYPAVGQQAEDRGALLRGLDKITARITTFDSPLGEEVQFGTLRIITQTCQTTDRSFCIFWRDSLISNLWVSNRKNIVSQPHLASMN